MKFKGKKAMKKLLFTIFTLLFIFGLASAGIFDDISTVKKARCYANCITKISKIPKNDTNCESTECLQCKSPCDRNFISFASCNASCNTSFCEGSCQFLEEVSNWGSIYNGNSSISPPGSATIKSNNISVLELAWLPPQNFSGSVVYLIKFENTGDYRSKNPNLLTGDVYLNTFAVLNAATLCDLMSGRRYGYDGINFIFTIVALTESSPLVEASKSDQINFIKEEAVGSIYNPYAYYDSSSSGDKLRIQVTFNPSSGLMGKNASYVMVTKGSEIHVNRNSLNLLTTDKPSNISVLIFQETVSMKITIKVYSMQSCLPSKNKEIIYHYKGCHHADYFSRTLCCEIDPDLTNSSESTRKVRNLTHTPLQITDDFLFNTQVTWEPPVHSCPAIKSYSIQHEDSERKFLGRVWISKNVMTSNTYLNITNIKPGVKYRFEIDPKFGQFQDVGVKTTLFFKTPDVPTDDSSIKTIQHSMSLFSLQSLFVVNISWTKPVFNYSVITRYNITYTLQGDGSKSNFTTNHWFTIPGLDFGQTLTYQVEPIYKDAWIKTKTKIGEPVKQDPSKDSLIIRNLTVGSDFTKNAPNNLYSIIFTWLPPTFVKTVESYEIRYEIKGLLENDLVCPPVNIDDSRNSSCQSLKVENTSYELTNIRPKSRIDFTVIPVFVDSRFVSGRKESISVRAPVGPSTGSGGTPPTSGLTKGETAGLVIGIIVLVVFILLIIVILLRSVRQKEINDGKRVDSKRGAFIDHWEVFHEKLLLEDVIGQGAFGKVYKGMLAELPEQSSKYTSNMSFRRKSTRQSVKQDDGYVVAVKMLQDVADDEQRREFLKEIQLMKDVGSHRNIVNMLGCGTLSDPMFLIVEYLPNGDLLHYLRKRRGNVNKYPDSDPRGPYHSTYCQTYFNRNKPIGISSITHEEKTQNDPPTYTFFNKIINRGFQDDNVGDVQLVSIQHDVKNTDVVPGKQDDLDYDDDDNNITSGDLMAFAWQVSEGMEFLTKRGYVHRDLAARNVLVGENKEAKIADFGLTRHTYNSLYQAKTNRRLPIKWMSIEAIFDQNFTEKSDVWSYGVFLWELVTLGGTPYPTRSIREILKALKDGYRMEKPETCDNEIYGIMLSCWEEKPEDRPTFTMIRNKLEEMMMRDNPYFDPSSVDESRDYYNVPSFNSIENSDGIEDEVFDGIFGEKKLLQDQNGRTNGACNSETDDKESESENVAIETREKNKNLGIEDMESLISRGQLSSSSLSI